MNKIIGITSLAVLASAQMASAQIVTRENPGYPAAPGVNQVYPEGPAVRADRRAGNLVPPSRDPDSTNTRRSDRGGGPYHEEITPQGGVTGPLPEPANGGG